MNLILLLCYRLVAEIDVIGVPHSRCGYALIEVLISVSWLLPTLKIETDVHATLRLSSLRAPPHERLLSLIKSLLLLG